LNNFAAAASRRPACRPAAYPDSIGLAVTLIFKANGALNPTSQNRHPEPIHSFASSAFAEPQL
jgi:hypothetical protein